MLCFAMILIGVKQSSLVGDGEQDSRRLIHYCLGEVDDAISVPHWSHIKCQERWNLSGRNSAVDFQGHDLVILSFCGSVTEAICSG